MRRFTEFCRDVLRLLKGFVIYWWSGETPEWAYQTMISLFCRTRGISNDVMHFFTRIFSPRYSFPKKSGVLGDLSEDELSIITSELQTRGFYIFKTRLPLKICDEIMEFALKTPSWAYSDLHKEKKMTVYHPEQPISEIYRFEEYRLVELPAIQGLMTDFSLLSVAQQYFGCAPILDQVGLA